MSGATMVCTEEVKNGTVGESPKDTYDDLQDISELRSLITGNPNRAVDNLVIKQDQSEIHTALVVGPLIYGQGHGPVHQRSIQAPGIARSTLARKHGFRLGAGKNVWSNVHIRDLGTLFSVLPNAVTSNQKDVWNDVGLFVPENGALAFGDLCSSIAHECHTQGLLENTDLDVITSEEANKLSAHANILWGTNAVLRSSRARKYLAWKPFAPSLLAEIPDSVRREAAAQKL